MYTSQTSTDLTIFQILHGAVVYIKASTGNVNRVQVQKKAKIIWLIYPSMALFETVVPKIFVCALLSQ